MLTTHELTRGRSWDVKSLPESVRVIEEPFDFVAGITGGPMLLVGEGNLSFAAVLAERSSRPTNILATTFEREVELEAIARHNASRVRKAGGVVAYGVDATKLPAGQRMAFRALVFQFPNVASRRSVFGSTANHHLVRGFLRSARSVLHPSGVVAITIVDRPYYHGQFDIPHAAAKAGFTLDSVRPFYRTHWQGYAHTNTLDVASALRASYRASTFVLSQKHDG